MTVGIAFTNGLEAIAITDSRASGYGRQTDSVNKMGDFSHEAYTGVIFGTGSGSLIEGIVRNLQDFSGETLDEFVKKIHETYKNRVYGYDESWLLTKKEEIRKKSLLIDDEQERKQFIDQQNAMARQGYDQTKQDPSNMAYFILAAYDKKVNKIRLFQIGRNSNDPFEISVSHIEIGSGIDGANLYLGTKLQGVDSTKLTIPYLAFFAVNAYSLSTVDQGVGGTPKIARISKDGCSILPVEKTIALANLSGAYLSESSAPALGRKEVLRAFEKILNKDQPGYDAIARKIGLDSGNTLTTLCIPYSSWQESTNRTFFRERKSSSSK